MNLSINLLTLLKLDLDILSVPSSIPEDIFETLNTAMEVQNSADYQGDGNSGNEQELESL